MKTILVLFLLWSLSPLAASATALDEAEPGSVAAREDRLLVRFAALIGSRDLGTTPVGGVVYSPAELAETIVDWNPGRDDSEVKRVLQLSELGEALRQIGELPAGGGRLSATFVLRSATFDVDLHVLTSERNPDMVVGRVELSRDGKLVSAPQISTQLGDRAILTATDPDSSLFHLYVFEVERVAGDRLDALGLRGAWDERSEVRRVERERVPQPIWGKRPEYTAEALRDGVQGTVTLRVQVAADGTAGEIEVIRGLPAGLTERAIEAVRAMRFQPAKQKGQPVAGETTIGIGFSKPQASAAE